MDTGMNARRKGPAGWLAGPLLTACIVLIFLVLPQGQALAEGATYYVAPWGNNASPGTFAQPWASIDYAAMMAQAGDTIIIRGGIYEEWVETRRSGAPGAPITFRAYPGERPILDGYRLEWGTGFAIAGEHSYIRLEGLTIRNFSGYGLVLWGSNHHIELVNLEIYGCDTALRLTEFAIPGSTVEDVLVEGLYLHDNALLGMDCSPGPCRRLTIRDTISARNGTGNNTAADGFAFESGEDILVERCQAYRNAGDGFDFKTAGTRLSRVLSWGNVRNGIKLWNVGAALENSISRDNGLAGVVLEAGGTYTLTNNVVAHNALETGDYGMYVAYDPPAAAELRLFNNIFAFNGSGVYFGEHVLLWEDHNLYYSREDSEIQAAFTSRVDYSRLDLNTGLWYIETGNGRHSASIDPAFRDPAARDYHLRPDSPAIDAGSTAWAPAVDFDGVPRPQGLAADIGAYEWIVWGNRVWMPLLQR
jgi:hypothetical protein